MQDGLTCVAPLHAQLPHFGGDGLHPGARVSGGVSHLVMALIQDLASIQELLQPLEERGVLVKRSDAQLLRWVASVRPNPDLERSGLSAV